MKGWVKWNLRTKLVIATVGLIAGIAACVLGNAIVKAEELTYSAMHFETDDVQNASVSYKYEGDENGPTNRIALIREVDESGDVIRCAMVRWGLSQPAPSFSFESWGVKVTAASIGDHSITKDGTGPCVLDSRLEAYDCKTTPSIICKYHCVPDSKSLYCDAAKETDTYPNQGGYSSMNAGAGCN